MIDSEANPKGRSRENDADDKPTRIIESHMHKKDGGLYPFLCQIKKKHTF